MLRFCNVVKNNTRLKIVTLEVYNEKMISYFYLDLPTLRFSIWYWLLRRRKIVTLEILRDIQRYDFPIRVMYGTKRPSAGQPCDTLAIPEDRKPACLEKKSSLSALGATHSLSWNILSLNVRSERGFSELCVR